MLRRHDPSWATEWFAMAGGHVVLCGAGLYVNAALGAGYDVPITDADLDRLEHRSAAVGVPAAVEVSPATLPASSDVLSRRNYRERRYRAAVVMPIDSARRHRSESDDPTITIEPAAGPLLGLWQSTTASGFGIVDGEARRASDAFARAAAEVDRDGFLIVRSSDDGRPIGCGSLTIRDGLATLGGMSTVPSERRRGVQGALIRHRLAIAEDAGCDLVASSAVVGGDSERNLLRHGFVRSHVTTMMQHLEVGDGH